MKPYILSLKCVECGNSFSIEPCKDTIWICSPKQEVHQIKAINGNGKLSVEVDKLITCKCESKLIIVDK